MKAALCLLLVVLAQLCVVSVGQEHPATITSSNSARGTTWITHVTVIDTKMDKSLRDRTVVISDDRISGVKDSKKRKPSAGAKVVDGTGKYLIPGLWDMHVQP